MCYEACRLTFLYLSLDRFMISWEHIQVIYDRSKFRRFPTIFIQQPYL